MDLLDLPPELFQRIIGIYVTAESAQKAARIRIVCSTFHDYINEELFARQPISKFTTGPGKRLLEKNLASFLVYRMRSLHGAPNFLPTLIRGVVDRRMRFGNHPEAMRNNITDSVIRVIIKQSETHFVKLALTPTKVHCQDLSDDRLDLITLAVALYAHAPDEVTNMVDNGVDPWGQSGIFRNAIWVATRVNDDNLMEKLLAAIDNSNVGRYAGFALKKRRKGQAPIIWQAVETAFFQRRWLLVNWLMEWSHGRVTRPSLTLVRRWVKMAVASDEMQTVVRMAELGYLRHSLSGPSGIVVPGLLCNSNPEPALRLCIQERLLDPGEDLSISPLYQPGRLLDIAIYEENVPLVKAALAVKAYSHLPTSLRLAIRRESASIVRALLDGGADPEAPMHLPERRTT